MNSDLYKNKTLTVFDLIEILSHYNPDLEVWARGNDADFYALIRADIRETKMCGKMALEIDGFK